MCRRKYNPLRAGFLLCKAYKGIVSDCKAAL